MPPHRYINSRLIDKYVDKPYLIKVKFRKKKLIKKKKSDARPLKTILNA